eukprot:1318864-Karenia_brevis.AAC.1
MPTFGLSTAASWWPNRDYISTSSQELEFALPHPQHDGLACTGYLRGFISSSTRAELLGVIIALLAPIPVHIALDNLAVVKKAQYFHNILLSNTAHTKILFTQINNGDLWILFHYIVQKRGPKSCAFSWTKGHALSPDNASFLQKYPFLRYQAQHNDKVDKFAEKAYTSFFNANVIALSDLLVARTSSYIFFTKQ